MYNDVKNKTDIHTEFIKEESFKNVEEPVKVYKVSCDERSIREFITQKLKEKKDQQKTFYTKPLIKISFAIIPIVAIIIIFLFYSGTSLPFEERDWIVITDFENLTQEPMFDHLLNTFLVKEQFL